MRSRLLATVFFGSLVACHPTDGLRHAMIAADAPLRLVRRPSDEACAYVTAAGDTVIPFGRYQFAPEQFDKVAILLKPGVGWVGIDRQERVLFQPFLFDNGPDYPAEGVLRIVDAAGRLGYADSATGRVVLPSQYEAARPFAGRRALVGSGCRVVTQGEHWSWDCQEWHYIDHQGNVVAKAVD
jgi:hypothetical protein